MLRWVLTALSAVLFGAVTAGCTAPEQRRIQEFPPETVDELRDIVEHAAEQTVGGTLLYIDWPGTNIELEAGLKGDLGEQAPAEAAFRPASITKLFTSAVILQLAEEGELALDDAAAGLLPERMDAFEFGDEITIAQLLGHTSGLSDFLRDPAYLPELVEHATVAEDAVTASCDDLAQVDPLSFVTGKASFTPGNAFEYSNSGYLVAGEVIEHVTGRPLHDSYRDRILDPLELDGTWLACAERPRAELVPGYHAPGSFDFTIPGQGDEPVEVTGVHDVNLWAAGGLVSTPEDLAAFARTLFSGDLFHEATTLDEMLETTENASYGLGVRIGEGAIYGHDGLAPGYGTHLHYDSDSDLVVLVMINETAPGLPGEIGSMIQRTLEEVGRH